MIISGDLLFYGFKVFVTVFSAVATALSLLFMLNPQTFRYLEEAMGMEIGWESSVSTILEGRITIVNDWAYRNHFFLGPLLAILAAWNTRSAFFM